MQEECFTKNQFRYATEGGRTVFALGKVDVMGGTAVHQFEVGVHAPARARRFGRATLSSWGMAGLADVVELLLSEVVTNAVTHAQSGGEIRFFVNGQAVRVEVSDAGRGCVTPRDAGPDDVSGRGMAIVDALATRWGVEPSDALDATGNGYTAKTVWFEVDLPGT